eukprot:GHRR01011856.1.p1 GENE.GHRR01011856.1~~GHRR01011856.1.p1  ORF type:complete len:143 (-),score=34.87 GHRR01011856.1:1759-2187(-)
MLISTIRKFHICLQGQQSTQQQQQQTGCATNMEQTLDKFRAMQPQIAVRSNTGHRMKLYILSILLAKARLQAAEPAGSNSSAATPATVLFGPFAHCQCWWQFNTLMPCLYNMTAVLCGWSCCSELCTQPTTTFLASFKVNQT